MQINKELFLKHKKKVVTSGIAGIIMLLLSSFLVGCMGSFTVMKANEPVMSYSIEMHDDDFLMEIYKMEHMK